MRIVMESLTTSITLAELCRKYNLKPNVFYDWKQKFIEGEKHHVIPKEEGLQYAYIGNTPGHPLEHTYCPECKDIAVLRYGCSIKSWNLDANNCCKNCGYPISIIGKPIKLEKNIIGKPINPASINRQSVIIKPTTVTAMIPNLKAGSYHN
jgi:hypothetical protein